MSWCEMWVQNCFETDFQHFYYYHNDKNSFLECLIEHGRLPNYHPFSVVPTKSSFTSVFVEKDCSIGLITD